MNILILLYQIIIELISYTFVLCVEIDTCECNLWNNMSNEMRESTSLEIFKTKYLNEYFN
jgi:hypothetical protein